MDEHPTHTHPVRGAAPTMVALTGFMGSGKTTVGEELAELLGWAFVDLDAVIERQEQAVIAELFQRKGEAGFREIEHATLKAVLTGCARPTILALGGGAFVQRNNAELLRQAWIRTVYLEVSVDELLRRCVGSGEAGAENSRPLAADEAAFRRLHEERLPSYRCADLTISADEKTPAEIAAMTAAALHLRPRPEPGQSR